MQRKEIESKLFDEFRDGDDYKQSLLFELLVLYSGFESLVAVYQTYKEKTHNRKEPADG